MPLSGQVCMAHHIHKLLKFFLIWTGGEFFEVQCNNTWLVCLEQRRNFLLYCFYALEEMLKQGSQQVRSCGQLSSGPASYPVSFPLRRTSDMGAQILSLTQASVSVVVKSSSGMKICSRDFEECVCSHLCHWQKLAYMIVHMSAHPGVCGRAAWGRLQLTSLCRVSSYWQYEIQNLWAWNAKSNRTIYTSCKQLAIDSSIFHIAQTKTVVMAAGIDSYCLVMPASSCMASAQIL